MPSERNWSRSIQVAVGISGIVLGCLLTVARHPAVGEDSASQPPHRIFDRVMLIVLENSKYTDALRQPFLRHLMTIGASFTDFHAIAHPSYPNYLAMVAGSTFGIRDDKRRDLDATSLADLFDSSGVSWKVYAENLPGNCFTGSQSQDSLYVRQHEPFISFRPVQINPLRCLRIVNAAQFKTDLATNALPEYSLYVPNLRNDGHDASLLDPRAWSQTLLGRNPGLANADAWLKGFLSPLLGNPQFTRGTLVIVTFDENNGAGGNQVYTVFVGPMVQAGVTNGRRYDHYSLLRTIEENYALGTLGREDATATPICCVWRN